MKVVIAGGTGQIGHLLCRDFVARHWDVVVLGRGRFPDSLGGVRFVPWDARRAGAWCNEVDGSDLVVNLAGRSVDCRYTAANKRQIFDSRINSTRAITAAIANSINPPPLLLQASTATIYSHRFDGANDEDNGVIGGHEPDSPASWRFSIDVATAWEQAAIDKPLPQTRSVLMRSAITLSPDRGGIFDVLLRLVRFGLGGTCAGGRQFVSWIHDADFVNAVHWLIEREDIEGPINLCSPHPIRQAEFIRILRRAWGQPIGLPATRWMLELGAIALRTETELILKSRRVVPTRLIDSGFRFQLPDWTEAAADLCRRRKGLRVDDKSEPIRPGLETV
jgi:uncharacterized protein (TIGR01777 family)